MAPTVSLWECGRAENIVQCHRSPQGADIRAEPLPGMSNIERTQQTPTELSKELFGCQMCQMWSYKNETQLYPQQPIMQQWEWAWEIMQTEICPRWRNLFMKLAVKYIEICSLTYTERLLDIWPHLDARPRRGRQRRGAPRMGAFLF